MKTKILLTLISACSLSACSTVKMPNLDFLDAGFEEDARNIDQSVPSVDEAPDIPTGVRTTAEWDKSAREMINLRDRFTVPVSPEPAVSEQEFDERFESLKSKAQAYNCLLYTSDAADD